MAGEPGDRMPPLAIVDYAAIDSGVPAPPYVLSVVGPDALTNWDRSSPEEYRAKRARWQDAIVSYLEKHYRRVVGRHCRLLVQYSILGAAISRCTVRLGLWFCANTIDLPEVLTDANECDARSPAFTSASAYAGSWRLHRRHSVGRGLRRYNLELRADAQFVFTRNRKRLRADERDEVALPLPCRGFTQGTDQGIVRLSISRARNCDHPAAPEQKYTVSLATENCPFPDLHHRLRTTSPLSPISSDGMRFEPGLWRCLESYFEPKGNPFSARDDVAAKIVVTKTSARTACRPIFKVITVESSNFNCAPL